MKSHDTFTHLGKPPNKKTIFLGEVPNLGGWGGPKVLVKFINHCFDGRFDHYVSLEVPNLWNWGGFESQIYGVGGFPIKTVFFGIFPYAIFIERKTLLNIYCVFIVQVLQNWDSPDKWLNSLRLSLFHSQNFLFLLSFSPTSLNPRIIYFKNVERTHSFLV